MNWIGLGTGVVSNFGGCRDSMSGSYTACGERLTTVDSSGNCSDTSVAGTNYCSLPTAVWVKYGLQCGNPVRFVRNGVEVMCYLADKGPAPNQVPNRIADMSPGAFAQLTGNLGLGLADNTTVFVDTGNTNGAANYGQPNSTILPSDTPLGGLGLSMTPTSSNGGVTLFGMTALDPYLKRLLIALLLLWIVTFALPYKEGIYLPWLATAGFLLQDGNFSILNRVTKFFNNPGT